MAAACAERGKGGTSFYVNGRLFDPAAPATESEPLRQAREEFTSIVLGRIEDLLRKPKSMRRHVERERKMIIAESPDDGMRERVRRMTYDQFTGYLIGFYERGLLNMEVMIRSGHDGQQAALEFLEEGLKSN
jgi:hypothetical protein